MSTVPVPPASSPPVRLTYPALLRLPTALPALAATSLARLGYGAVSLALLLDVRARTGSFRLAGLAVAAFAVAAVAMPLKARVIDRHGQRRVLPALGVLHALPLLAVLVLPGSGVVAAAALAGLAAPPVGPSMRARWSALTAGADRDRAFALDTVGEEALYVLSPAAAGGLAAWSPGLGLVVVAAAVGLGAVGLGLTPGAPPVGPAGDRARGLRLPPGLSAGLAVAVGFGAAVAVLEFAVTARAVGSGDAAWTGVLLSTVAVGSVLGGLLWGRRVHRRGAGVHVVALASWIASGAVVAAFAPPIVALGAVLAVAGLAVSPLLVVVYLAVDARTAPRRRTEANTWVATGMNLGAAGGSAVGGLLLGGLGGQWLTAAAALPLLVATVAAPWLAGDLSGGGRRTARG